MIIENINQWFTVRSITKDVWGIGEFKHPEEVISYLIVGNKEALLFDTGMGIENIKTVVKKITKLPVKVINSHTHFDHIGNNYRFEDVMVFDHIFSLTNAKSGFKKYKVHSFGWIKKICDSEIVELNPYRFEVIHTPGHSPDSICLYEKEKGWLFSGDTLYEGPLYLHLSESNKKSFVESIKKIILLPFLTHIFPSHNSFSFPLSALIKIYEKKKEIVDKNSKTKNIQINNTISILL